MNRVLISGYYGFANAGDEAMLSAIIASLKDIKSDIDWNYYKDFIETPNTVLLLYGKKQYSVIPKKAFDNTELGNFILLLKNKFQNKKK